MAGKEGLSGETGGGDGLLPLYPVYQFQPVEGTDSEEAFVMLRAHRASAD